MTIDQLAASTLATVRAWYKTSLKSNNKWRSQTSPEDVEVEWGRIHASALTQTLGRASAFENLYTYGSKMGVVYEAGNCWDLAIAALDRALSTDVTATLRVVCIPPPGDHAFLAIGGKAEEVLLPFGFVHGHQNYCVCDPWANIACRGNEYVDTFNAKMVKWACEGKLISFRDNWISPLDHQWLNGLLGYKTISHRGLID